MAPKFAKQLACLLLISFFALAVVASRENDVSLARDPENDLSSALDPENDVSLDPENDVSLDPENGVSLARDPENNVSLAPNVCVYTMYVQTGGRLKAGTDSVIGVTLRGPDGDGVHIANLEAWGGLMGKGHDYYEQGNLDIFSGRGPCLKRPPCWMNLTSDGTGLFSSWYCKSVEVIYSRSQMGCKNQLFTVEQWFSRILWPFRLYAVSDQCPKKLDEGEATAL